VTSVTVFYPLIPISASAPQLFRLSIGGISAVGAVHWFRTRAVGKTRKYHGPAASRRATVNVCCIDLSSTSQKRRRLRSLVPYVT
jgi:hypothetical protein